VAAVPSGLSPTPLIIIIIIIIIITDAIKNVHDSWEEVKMSSLTGVWKFISTPVDDFEGFKQHRTLQRSFL
jgi:hypothetical protein